ncbi:putative vesicle transport protein, Use1 [Helianthus anomalus]
MFEIWWTKINVIVLSNEYTWKLEEDLTDEMVGLARQLKESTLMMNQSIKNIEKVNS